MLDLIWSAQFKDGSTLNQFDDRTTQAKEHPFKEVLERQDNLVKFTLVNIHTNVAYILNLENGTVGITLRGLDCIEPDVDMLRKNPCQYRLIYFRRVKRYFTPTLIETGTADITYFLGFQYNDLTGHNHKRLLRINQDGRVLIN